MTWRKFKYLVARAIIKPFGNWQLYPYPMFLLMGDTHYQVKGREVRHVLGTARKGDILLRKYRHYVSGWLIPGHYNHVGILVEDDRVVHALGRGVVEEDVLTFLRTDEVAVVRPRATEERVGVACDEARRMLGREYDFIFDTVDDGRFYCSELVKHCYEGVFDLPGDKVIEPSVFLEHDSVDVVHESRAWRAREN